MSWGDKQEEFSQYSQIGHLKMVQGSSTFFDLLLWKESKPQSVVTPALGLKMVAEECCL